MAKAYCNGLMVPDTKASGTRVTCRASGHFYILIMMCIRVSLLPIGPTEKVSILRTLARHMMGIGFKISHTVKAGRPLKTDANTQVNLKTVESMAMAFINFPINLSIRAIGRTMNSTEWVSLFGETVENTAENGNKA